MNPILFSFARQALMFVGGYFVSKGFVGADTLNTVIGAVLAAAASVASTSVAVSNSKSLGPNDKHRAL